MLNYETVQCTHSVYTGSLALINIASLAGISRGAKRARSVQTFVQTELAAKVVKFLGLFKGLFWQS